jgi:hypothetical protein
VRHGSRRRPSAFGIKAIESSENEIGLGLLEDSGKSAQSLGMEPIIGIEELDIGTCRRGNSGISCRRGPTIRLGHGGESDAGSFSLALERNDGVRRVVGGTIIGHHDLDPAVLCAKTLSMASRSRSGRL